MINLKDMRKKVILAIALWGFCFTSIHAQVPQNPVIIDQDEAIDIDSLSMIVETMNKRGSDMNLEEALKTSWKRKTFFRLSYTTSKFEALADDNQDKWKEYASKLDGVYEGEDKYHYKSEYGVSLQWGRNIALHKNPIAKTVVIALDYTWIDLNWNKYKVFYDDDHTFDSSKTWLDEKGGSHYFLPWGANKNELNYGMSLGPSITVAPFGAMDKSARDLHLQGYFHIGYSISTIFMNLDEDLNDEGNSFKLLGSWGHGLTRSWGINLSWKAIGVGFEKRTSSFSYSPVGDEYGSRKIKFDLYNTRWYLSFNF